jgi:C1A family cysteine protease
MSKIIRRALLVGLAGVLALGGPAAQDTGADGPLGTGLKPLDAVEVERIAAAWPRITRVGLNRLGLERINEVRARKGKPALDTSVAEPIGAEARGFRAVPGAAVQSAEANALMADDLPVSVDNSLLRYFPPIRSQGAIGSCASFASTYTQLSYMTAFQRNLDIRNAADNTNKYSPKWSYNMVNGGVDEGSGFLDNYTLLERHGAATWAEFPYDSDVRGWCLDPSAWRNALGVRTKAIQYVYDVDTDLGLDLVKELLTDGYVVVFGTYITSWVFTAVPNDASTADDDAAVGKAIGYWLNGNEGGHAMTIVGYNDAIWTDVNTNGLIDPGEKGAFRVANSWGTTWRPTGYPSDGGFVWLAYDALKRPSGVAGGPSVGRVAAFQSDMVFVLTARDDYAPLMIGEFTVSHAKRNQLRLFLGTSGPSASTPSVTWTPSAFQNDGGAYAFDGSTTAVAATFSLDFTDILAGGAGTQRYYLGVSDNAAGDPATLSAFKIVDLTTDPDTEAASALVPQTPDSQTAYAYVAYDYLGQAYNDPPQVTSPQVSPATGRTGDTFTFNVRYVDADGDAPAVSNLVLDDVARPMTLYSGSAANGWYTFSTTLPAGQHYFYCYFEDGRGGTGRAPVAGDINSPVAYGHTITSLAPSSATAGGAAFTLVANGTDFADGYVVTWDGADRPTTFVSATRLEAQIGAGDLAVGRTVPVVVRGTSGQLSNVIQFPVNNPTPTLTSVNPAAATGGGSSLTLILHGTGFVPNSVVRLQGLDVATTYVSATEVRGALAAQNLAAGGDLELAVVNPAPGGGASSALTFPVSDFTLAIAAPDLSAAAGASASCVIEVAPRYGSFDAAVSFGCLGLPQGTTASFSPATVTPGAASATTTMTLTTTARGTVLAAAAAGPAGPAATGLGLVLLFAAFAWPPLLRRPAAARVPARRRLAAAALILLAVGLAGCGAGGSDDNSNQGTPAGTYSIIVRGTSGGLTAQGTVTLVVN